MEDTISEGCVSVSWSRQMPQPQSGPCKAQDQETTEEVICPEEVWHWQAERPRTQAQFQTFLSNRFLALADPASGTSEWWEKMKGAMSASSEELLVFRRALKESWISNHTWNLIKERKDLHQKRHNATSGSSAFYQCSCLSWGVPPAKWSSNACKKWLTTSCMNSKQDSNQSILV